MRKVLFLAAAIGAAVVAYFVFVPETARPSFLASEFENYCRVCDEVIRDRLKSPSSYIRSSCQGPYSEAASEKSYFEYTRKSAWEEYDERTRKEVENGALLISTAYVEYEAANSYGALIRGLSVCQIDHKEGRSLKSAVGILGPYVDGYTKYGWTRKLLVDQLSQ